MIELHRPSVKCLLVDDLQENLLALEAVLEGENAEFIKARSGNEALELLLQHEFALALIDVQMPGMDGFELAELMRGMERTRSVPIIFVTAGSHDQRRIFEGYEQGAVDFMYKPLDAHAVRSKVRVFIELNAQIQRAETALKQAEDAKSRLRLLSDAGAALTRSLDLEQTLSDFANVTVPALCDWCSIDLLSASGMKERILLHHRDSGIKEAAAGLDTSFPPLADSRVFEEMLQAKTTQRVANLPEAGLMDPELSGKLGLHSLILAPLLTRSQVIGVLSLARGRERPPFTEEDAEIAQELARRTAWAIENGQLFESAEKAVRIRDEFLSIASHELRTPLTAMTLQLQLLQRIKEQTTDLPALKDHVGRMLETSLKQVDSLRALIDDLLDVTRITSGRLPLEPEPMTLASVVDDVIEQFCQQLEHAGCPVTVQKTDPCHGSWDRQRLNQVVLNLVSNAAKYGARKPILIRLERENGICRLKVQDQGIGIPPEDLDRVFDRFERINPSRQVRGLGLGLYIVKKIVDAHSGSIWVESEVGKGSTFILELPGTP